MTLLRIVSFALLALVLGAALVVPAQAQTGGGTIYYKDKGQTYEGFYSMDGDGNNVTQYSDATYNPTQATHCGQRWFIFFQEVVGQSYPDGGTRDVAFARSEDGTEVQLTTDDPLLQLSGKNNRLWAPGVGGAADGRFSMTFRRWAGNPPAVVEGGLYTADVDWSDCAAGPQLGALSLAIPATMVNNQPDLHYADWSPDGQTVVFSREWTSQAFQLHTAALGNPTNHTALPVYGDLSRWSPDGNWILYREWSPKFGSIRKVKPNGTNVKKLVNASGSITYYRPSWSPTGSHISYLKVQGNGLWTNKRWVFRATNSGGAQTQLTPQLGPLSDHYGWVTGP
jgi:hypothetical protein